MPELPEVEVVKQGLVPLLTGRSVLDCGFSGKSLRLALQPGLFQKWLVGAAIERLERRAKYIIVWMDNKAQLVIHLGMTGKLGLFQQGVPWRDHDHIWLGLDDGMELRYNDVRRFGSFQVFPPHDAPGDLFAALGPEPFGADFSVAYLRNKAKNRKQPIKNFLMDSHVVAGVGNIYANEILFAAAILPETPAFRLTAPQWRRVIVQTRFVLQRAIAAGGSTIADFVGSSGEKGYFQLQLNVYGRTGKNCTVCGGSIVRTVMAGRATFYCGACQK